MITQAPSRWLKFPDLARWGASGPEVPWIEVQCPNHGVFRVQCGVLKVKYANYVPLTWRPRSIFLFGLQGITHQ